MGHKANPKVTTLERELVGLGEVGFHGSGDKLHLFCFFRYCLCSLAFPSFPLAPDMAKVVHGWFHREESKRNSCIMRLAHRKRVPGQQLHNPLDAHVIQAWLNITWKSTRTSEKGADSRPLHRPQNGHLVAYTWGRSTSRFYKMEWSWCCGHGLQKMSWNLSLCRITCYKERAPCSGRLASLHLK